MTYQTASGQKDSGSYDHLLYTVYDWSVELDTDNMLAHWTISATIYRTHYGDVGINYASVIRGSMSDNYIKLTDPNRNLTKTVWPPAGTTVPGNAGSTLYPYAYTGTGDSYWNNKTSCCADKISTLMYDKGSLAGKYPRGYCHLLSGYKYDTVIKDDGTTKLRLRSVLHDTNSREDDTSFTTTPSPHNPFDYTFQTGHDGIPVADVFSKVKRVTGSTGNWTDGGYIWQRFQARYNDDRDWRKMKLYRKDTDTYGDNRDWVKK